MSLQFIADFDSQSAPTSPVLVTQWATPSLVLTGHLDGYLRAWDALNGRLLAEVEAHTQSLNSLSAGQSADKVLSGSIDGSMSLYNTADFARPQASPEPAASCTSLSSSTVAPSFAVALHPHRPIFASTGHGAGCSLHNADPASFGALLDSYDPTRTPSSSSTSSSTPPFGLTLSFSPSGSLLALGTTQGHVQLFRITEVDGQDPTLVPIATITSHALPIRSLAFASDVDRKGRTHDDLLFVGGDDAIVTAYDVRSHADVSAEEATGKAPLEPASKNPVAVLMGHKGPVTSLCAVPPLTAGASSGPRLLSSTSRTDGTVRIWDLSARPKSAVFVTKLDVAPSGGIDWRRSTPAAGEQRGEHEEEATGAAGAGAGAAFVVAGNDGRARWFRLAGTGLDAVEERESGAVAATAAAGAAAAEGQVNGAAGGDGEHSG